MKSLNRQKPDAINKNRSNVFGCSARFRPEIIGIYLNP